jgi:hypothetical protein
MIASSTNLFYVFRNQQHLLHFLRHAEISVLFPTKCSYFHYLVLFGSCNINGLRKPCAKILMASEKNVVREGGLSPFKARCEKVK